MNETLQNELAAWLSGMRTDAGGLKEFAIDQAPQVVRDMITLGRIQSLFLAVALLAMAGGVVFVSSKMLKWAEKDRPGSFDLHPVVFLIGGLVELVLFLIFCGNFSDLVSSWFLPRIYVVETIAAMVGKLAGHP